MIGANVTIVSAIYLGQYLSVSEQLLLPLAIVFLYLPLCNFGCMMLSNIFFYLVKGICY